MRKITESAVRAFMNREDFKQDNTRVIHFDEDRTTVLYLHSNQIAKRTPGGLFVSNDGWETPTTKERLNGVLGHLGKYIYQKDYTWYLYDRKTDETVEFPCDEWVKVD